jgi:signal transduction histidine kinase/HAMP domain-containing protein
VIHHVFKVLISVKAKLFFGFAAMTILLVLLGGVAFLSIGQAGEVVEETFDRPLMAINYARSAGQVFAGLEIEHLRAVAEDEDASSTINYMTETFREDLKVAQERSIAPRAEPFFEQTFAELDGWLEARQRRDQDKERRHAEAIIENLDIIIELQTNESFRARQSAIDGMEQIKSYNLWAVLTALGLTIGLSTWLGVTIIRPLKAAATAARKISAGNLTETIPEGGDDETGALLKSMSVMQTNIRHRMEKEQDLRNLAQTRLIDSLENAQDAILLTDSDGEIIVANPMVKDLLAGPEILLLGQDLTTLFLEDGRPKDKAASEISTNDEFCLDDGRWFRVTISRTRDGGRLFIWTDVSDAKANNERLREARDQAQAADKAKTLFLAAMSHELRTPLNAVIGFADVLKIQAETRGEVENSKLAGLISQSGDHLLNIVQDVLFMAKGHETGQMEMMSEIVDLRSVIDFCMQTMSVEFENDQLRTVWKRPENAAYVKGDPLRLQQAVMNLLGNAVKFNRIKGAIMARLSDAGTSWRIDIVDTGIGMSKDDLAKVGEIFAQADNGYSRKYDGLGIGLNLVDRIVSGHNGQMQVQSRIDQGTSVSLFLPKHLTEDIGSGLERPSLAA